MSVNYRDAKGVQHDLETEPGEDEDEERPVHGLAPSIVATFTAIKAAVESLSGIVSGGKLAVADAILDGLVSGSRLATSNSALEALISAGRFATSNSALEALIAAG